MKPYLTVTQHRVITLWVWLVGCLFYFWHGEITTMIGAQLMGAAFLYKRQHFTFTEGS